MKKVNLKLFGYDRLFYKAMYVCYLLKLMQQP